MELSSQKGNSIKIKTKNATILIDPTVKSEGDVVVLTKADAELQIPKEGIKLIIQGPGEYEVGGVRITGKKLKDEIIYSFSSEYLRILLLPATSLTNLKEEDEYSAMVINTNADISEQAFSSYPSNFFILYGDSSKVTIPEQNMQKLNKINLKKRDEVGSSIIFLQ